MQETQLPSWLRRGRGWSAVGYSSADGQPTRRTCPDVFQSRSAARSQGRLIAYIRFDSLRHPGTHGMKGMW